MKLPWQSREIANQIERRRVDTAEQLARRTAECAEWSRLCADATNRYDEMVRNYHALLDKYVALATRPLPQTIITREHEPLPEAPARELSVIDAVIRLEAKGDHRLARYFRARAKRLKDDHPHWTDQQVATELSRWETAEEMPPEFLVGAKSIEKVD